MIRNVMSLKYNEIWKERQFSDDLQRTIPKIREYLENMEVDGEGKFVNGV